MNGSSSMEKKKSKDTVRDRTKFEVVPSYSSSSALDVALKEESDCLHKGHMERLRKEKKLNALLRAEAKSSEKDQGQETLLEDNSERVGRRGLLRKTN